MNSGERPTANDQQDEPQEWGWFLTETPEGILIVGVVDPQHGRIPQMGFVTKEIFGEFCRFVKQCEEKVVPSGLRQALDILEDAQQDEPRDTEQKDK